MSADENIVVLGARTHNLRNIDVIIPRNKLTVITGLSGSGKSSLAFDTIFAEGQRRYIDTFSAYARSFLTPVDRPEVDKIDGLSPVISIDQKTINRNPRSTVGTQTELYDFLRLLYARIGIAHSYATGEEMVKYTEEQVIATLLERYAGRNVIILAPVVRNRKGHYRELFDSLRKKGFLYVRVDGELCELVQGMKVERYRAHDIEVVIDRLRVSHNDEARVRDSVRLAMRHGNGIIAIYDTTTNSTRHFSKRLMCPTTGIAYADPAPHNFSFNSPQGACSECNGLGYLNYDDDEEQKTVCPLCQGKRLSQEALSYTIAGKNIAAIAALDITQLLAWIDALLPQLSERHATIATPIIKEIRSRVEFMLQVGLHYLSLSRPSATLSGGESQRIRLATQLGSRLVNVLYILDEPSIGLHPRDNNKLISTLKALRDIGNTVIIVEHDEETMMQADYIIDIGPRAGRDGGQVMFQGTVPQLLRADTLTAQYLRHEKQLAIPTRRKGNGKRLTLKGCTGNNLKNINLSLPLGTLIVITGVSGSGKSTVINDTLQPILSQHFYRSLRKPLPYKEIKGINYIDKVVTVDQTPIGKTSRSNAATYTTVFTDIRALFAELPEAKMRGYNLGHFSFNVSGGRCEACGGNGYKTIEMSLLPSVTTRCEVCLGKRYNRETLEVKYRGKSIADILNMSIEEATEFFKAIPHIYRKLSTLNDVGLGYITLGQPSTTLSGGECQRVKLATELARKDTGKTLYLLDEPTTGLHTDDIRVLLDSLQLLVNKGNTVVVIEHNIDIICAADYIIELGPDGGTNGGRVIHTGTPEHFASLIEQQADTAEQNANAVEQQETRVDKQQRPSPTAPYIHHKLHIA